MLPRDHAVKRTGQRHDAFDRAVRRLQHFVVVTVDRQVGVHIAITSVHVQGRPHPAFQHALVHRVALAQNALERQTRENILQWHAQLRLPAGAQGVVLQLGKQRVDAVQPARPQRAHLAHQSPGLRHTVFQKLGRRDVIGIVVLAQRQVALGKKIVQRIAQGNFVLQAQLDVDALNAVGVLGHARERNHHVFVDLERVGVLADGRGALAVQPEFFARLRADGNKAFAAARVGNAHHLGGGTGHVVGVVAGNVTKQHHLGQAAALGLGGITHRLQIAVIQMLQSGQQHTRALLLGEHEVLDFDNAGHGVFGIAKKLQAHRAGVAGHAVHHPARAGDQAVTTFFLNTGQAAQKLVGHVLAQALFAERRTRNVQALGAQRGLAVSLEILQLEAGNVGVMDLAHVVVDAGHLQPLGLRCHHAPAGQVVQRGAPQHGFFAPGIHGDVAANTRRLSRGGVHREHKTAPLRRVGHALRDHTRLGPDRAHRL